MKQPIIKADCLTLAMWKAIDKNIDFSRPFRVSLPRKKGRRKLVKVKAEFNRTGCDCCDDYWELVPVK